MEFREARERMVAGQLSGREIHDPRVLAAMGTVPRHEFVPAAWRDYAYSDTPLPIGKDQTISQPFIVALMSQWLALPAGSRVLDVGSGCGYQAAVLAELGLEVYGLEIVPELCALAAGNLRRCGYGDVCLRRGDGWRGWPDAAPFAGILVAAAAPRIPPRLLEQLTEGGRLVLPVGTGEQRLVGVTREAEGWKREELLPVRFVPLVEDRASRTEDPPT